MSKKQTIALTWWATWWHIFPLLAIHNYIKETKNIANSKWHLDKHWGYKFIWVWEEDSLEEKIATENKIKFIGISAGKIRRYLDYRNLYEPLKNLTGIVESIYHIYKSKIDIVFSKWGYVSLPMAIASKIMFKKLYIHESDTYWWISNKIVWLFANKIFYTFENDKIDGKKHILTWQIINTKLTKNIETPYNRENKRLSVLITWWSQWSTTIFEQVLKIIPDLSEINFTVILWSQNMHFWEAFKKYPNITVHDFIDQKDMWVILKHTDIAITRWWATTLWELYYFWIHSIIIPLANSAWNHQKLNAKYFHKKFESEIIEESEEISKILLKKLNKYKELRKLKMNLDKIEIPLEIIKEEIEK